MLKTLIGTTRPSFLILTLASLSLSVSWADFNGIAWNGGVLFLVLVATLFAHISVNMLNEYEDFNSGLDDMTERTPFSGGSGSLQKHPQLAEKVALIGYLLLGTVASIGVFFIYLRGWDILLIGILGLIIIVFYTPWITHYPILCLLVSGFAFGPLMVNGAYLVLTGNYDLSMLLISMIPFFLVNNLLLLNQIPDINADKSVGRYNFLHKYGIDAGIKIYFLNWLFAFLMLAILLLLGVFPKTVLITVLVLFLSIPLLLVVIKSKTDIKKLNLAMGLNVLLTIATPILISIGIYLNL
jgi:1,4-dihydroxy-2-naphthoate octaprenyltransferase